jgi:hypothetical protein
MRLGTAYLLLVLAITACQLGPQIEKFEQARRPEGITTTIELRHGFSESGRLEGELLEVREHGLLLRVQETREDSFVDRRLAFVPYSTMEEVEFDQMNLRVVGQQNELTEEYWPPSMQDRKKLRLLSRFPQGLSTPLLEQLLAAEGQAVVDVISRK